MSDQLNSLALDSAAILMIQCVAFKGKTLRLGAVCNPIKERYASEARHILEEVDCPPEKRPFAKQGYVIVGLVDFLLTPSAILV